MNRYQDYKERLKGLSYPYAVLDADLFRKNIQINLERAKDKKIRIASKSLRSVSAMQMILNSNDQFEGIMTYHGLETIYLAQQGFDNLLMGYPLVDKAIIGQIAKLVKAGKQICLMVDSLRHVEIINEVGKEAKVVIPVCVDIDLSDNYPGLRFGVWRSSIANLEQLENLLDRIKQMDFIRLDGLMGYEAQIAGVGDQMPGNWAKNQAIRLLKKRSLKRLVKRRQLAVDMIRSKEIELRFVNGGGTGSLETTREEEVVTEITVGSGFYQAHLFDNYQHFDLHPALFYAIQVVRIPKKGIYTAHGGGFVASGAIEASKAPMVYLPETGYLDDLEGAGEVQTPIRFKSLASFLAIGDPIFMRHAKSGELCERFNELHFLEGDQIVEWKTYRGEGLSFG